MWNCFISRGSKVYASLTLNCGCIHVLNQVIGIDKKRNMQDKDSCNNNILQCHPNLTQSDLLPSSSKHAGTNSFAVATLPHHLVDCSADYSVSTSPIFYSSQTSVYEYSSTHK
jgi:hypothetical protein